MVHQRGEQLMFKWMLLLIAICSTVFPLDSFSASEIIICTHGEKGNMPDKFGDFSPVAKIYCNDKDSNSFVTSLANLYKNGYHLITVVPIEYEVIGESRVQKSWRYYLEK